MVIEAEHLCMTVRGVRAGGASTITSALLGTLREDPRSRAEFLALTTADPVDAGTVAVMADRLGELTAAGVAIWLDDLSRARLATAAWPGWSTTVTSWA